MGLGNTMQKVAQALIWLVVLSSWAILTYWQYKSSGCGTYESFRDSLDASNYPNTTVTSSSSEFDNKKILPFIQISDLHLSKFEEHIGRAHFKHFLDNELPMINPNFVIVTGDLTDALSKRAFTSGQYEEEWIVYKKMLEEKGIFDRKDFWFDLRGNHDCFSVDSERASHQNFFSRYSVQKEPSYVKHIKMPFGVYSVVAIDGCPSYGPARPYNFFGSLPTPRMDQLEAHLKESQDLDAKHIFLIGHYPTVTLQAQRTTSGKSLADLTKHISAYFSGHLHQLLYGLGKTIRTIQPNGFADLELADLKENRMYRFAVVDNDVTSFSDHKIGTFPVIHISNPKDARYLIPNHEPTDLIVKSTQLRIFVFSPNPVVSVTITIDGDFRFEAQQSTEVLNLWTATWNPIKFANGKTHIIVVDAKDSTGKEQSRKEQFVIPPKSVPFYSFGELLLNLNFPRLIKVWFTLSYTFALAFVLFSFFYAHFGQADILIHRIHKKMHGLSQLPRSFSMLVRLTFARAQFWSLSFGRNYSLILPNIALLLYMTVGPWFVGYLADDTEAPGAVFLFGIKHQSSWTIMLDTWFYALFHLNIFVLPSIFLMAIISSRPTLIDPKYLEGSPKADNDDEDVGDGTDCDEEGLDFKYGWIFKFCIIIWLMEAFLRITRTLLNYGAMSFLLSPCYTWHFIWAASSILYYGERCRKRNIKRN